jgi:hypothetical protein
MRVIILCLLFFCQLPVQAADLTKISFEKAVFHEEGTKYQVSAEYPKFSGTKATAELIDQINVEVKAFAKQLVDTQWQSFVKGTSVLTKEDLESATSNSVDVTYKVIRADTKYVSIKFDRYYYALGAAHGVLDVFGFNYDVERRKIVKLADLFEPGVDYFKQVSDLCDIDLVRQLGAGFWTKGSLAKGDLEQFTFDKEAATIHFSAYQVTSYSGGTPEVIIPFKKLHGLQTSSTIKKVKKGDVLVYRDENIVWDEHGNEDFIDRKYSHGNKVRVKHEVVHKKEVVKEADHGLKYGFPLKVGMAWGDGVEGVGCSARHHTYCNYVEKKENVKVLAGVFKGCFKVVYETNPDTNIEWYCPGVGIVKTDYDHHGTITIIKSELQKIVSGKGMGE